MPAGPAVTPQPVHPLPAMTTYELRDYRRDLEHALTAAPHDDPARAQIQQQLTAVLAEQDDRAKIAAAR
jgi:hypothetical protein